MLKVQIKFRQLSKCNPKIKYPYYIQLTETDYFSLGSLYDTWTNRETGEILNTFNIITTPANPLMKKIHNLKKMPLILSAEDEMKWLDRNLKTDSIKELIKQFLELKMTAYIISREANNSWNNRDIPEIMNRVEYPELADEENRLF